MIPENIKKKHIIKALEHIDKFGIPKRRNSTKYILNFKENTYPPKYTISLANNYANGYELEPKKFSGGKETNHFLINLGFKIYDDQGKNVDTKMIISNDISASRDIEVSKDKTIKIATVLNSLNESYDEWLFNDIIRDISKKAHIILFPAGYFYHGNNKQFKEGIKVIEKEITDILRETNKSTVVCVGVDINNSYDQLAIAIDKTGVISIARKFYATSEEKGHIKESKSFIEKENEYSRIFEIKNRRFYLAVCYDIFGIRKNSLANPKVDSILNLIHGFDPKGEGNSGDVYFARLGLSGASKEWNCPVFAAATYRRRKIPSSWPSGVMWNKGKQSIQTWSYSDNTIFPTETIRYERPLETAEVRIFEL